MSPEMDPLAYLGSLSEEEMLAAFTPFGQQDAALQQQLQQALALRQQPQAQRSTGIGAGLSGLGGVLDTVNSHQQEGRLRAQQQDSLRGQQQEAAARMQAYVRALQGMQRTNPATAGMGDLLPPGAFGIG